jgi:peroxin-7
VSSDSQLRIFDLRTPNAARYHLISTIPVHTGPGAGPGAAPPAEVLTHDWNKYKDTVIATGGVDKVLRTFDIRNPAGGPLSILAGHDYAVRRLAWSPHSSDVLISGSYDMTVRLWNDASAMPQASPAGPQMGAQLGVMNRHTEFVTGVDWCLFGAGGWVASVGWDERVLLWDANLLMAR